MTPRERATEAASQLPERLKAARKLAGLTQDGVVAAGEFAPVTLSKIETGTNLPTFDILVRLAHVLDASPNYLLGWEGPSSTELPAERRKLVNELMLLAQHVSVEWLAEMVQLAKLAGRRL